MRDLAIILDSLRRAQAELAAMIAEQLEADPSNHMNLGRLLDLAARSAESARLFQEVLDAQDRDAGQSQALRELEDLAASFEKTRAALAARFGSTS